MNTIMNDEERFQKALRRGLLRKPPPDCEGCAFIRQEIKTHPRDMHRDILTVKVDMCTILTNQPTPIGATCEFYTRKELSTNTEIESMRKAAVAEHVRKKAGVT